MSNNVRIEVLLNAVDRASRPLKAIQTASKTLAGDIRTSQNSLRDLNAQASRIDGFRKASAQLAVTGQSLNKAKQEAAALAVQFKNTQNPTTAQARAMEAAKKSAADLQLKYNSLRQSVQRQRTELAQAGINTRTLSADELPGGRGKPVTREAHLAQLAERFRRQDVDRDGFLGEKELAAPPR